MNPSILIVDDEPMTRNLLRLMLERVGFDISEAGDGQEALDMVAEKQPDLLILDVMMPHVDGITVCERLRAQAETAVLPIILLSARTSPEAVRMGLEAGANKYVGKPVSREALIGHVRELLKAVPQIAD
ncbi:MAG: response regulator [Ardenticatenaceae bacterium]|nr:response regulator [Anaerolineales bacterium]MCB8941927.1 response regulator [Ardenticatenaceae bacterium]MCB8973041.1 response regulator [Ardenticatenaceae bacterium]